MTDLDPERLHREGPSLLRDALEAERGDGPDPARLRRIESALTAAPGIAPASGRGPWFFGSVLGGVALVTFVGIGLGVTRQQAPAVSATEAPAVAAPPPAAPAVAPSSPAEVVAIAAAEGAAKTAESPATSAATKVTTKAVGVAPTIGTESDEMALVARAQDALRGRPAEALALCREHERTFARGHFVQEREAIAIEALVYQKRTAEAERRWRAFERGYPTSSHRTHLAALFRPSGATEPGSAAP